MSRLYGILDKLADRGTQQQADWIATSASAWNTQLTNKITIPKGVYVVTVKAPVYTNANQQAWIGVGGVDDSAFIYAAYLATQGMFTCTLAVDSPKQIYAETRQSGAISFDPSYLTRGKLTVTRVG